MIQILCLLGIYFDAVVVEVTTFLLIFRLALAILCLVPTIFSDLPTTLQAGRSPGPACQKYSLHLSLDKPSPHTQQGKDQTT